jgi:hypothetical protein
VVVRVYVWCGIGMGEVWGGIGMGRRVEVYPRLYRGVGGVRKD